MSDMMKLAMALEPLVAAESKLEAALGPRASLDPTRARVTSLPALGGRMLAGVPDQANWPNYTRTLAAVALAQLEDFPGNLFWDMDAIAGAMARGARSVDDAHAYLQGFGDAMLKVHAAYGTHSTIRFRYVHDFVLGFDWERWVRADPERNAGIGPFDLAFLRRALTRSEEIADLVAQDDPAYRRLAEGEFRNPFEFSREPEYELRLHRDLFQRGGVPVRSWEMNAEPDCSVPHSRNRVARARELGIPPPASSS
jgi:hypothetical protein